MEIATSTMRSQSEKRTRHDFQVVGEILSAHAGVGWDDGFFAGEARDPRSGVIDNTTVDDYGPSFAAATLAFGVAQMLSPQLGGFIADLTGSFTAVFLLSSALAATGMIAAQLLPHRD